MRLVTMLRIASRPPADAAIRIDDSIFSEHLDVALRIERVHCPHVARHHVLDRDPVLVGAEISLRGDEQRADEYGGEDGMADWSEDEWAHGDT
jgi:hypothetical protein